MEDKKSIVVYADWIESFEALTDEEAGKLIKHFFRYVNDLSPEYPDRLTELSFIPIKQSLKRDLEKWKSTKEDRSTNGRKGNLRRYNVDLYDKFVTGELSLEDAEAIAINRKTSPPDKKDRPPTKKVANVAVNVNDSVSVNVNDNVNDTKADKIDFDALLFFINETFGRNFKTISNQVKAKYNVRLKDGYSKSDFKTAMLNCSKLQFHKDNNFQYCTPEYFSRAEILDKYSDVTEQEQAKEPEFDLYTDSVMKKVAIAKSFQK